MLDPYQSEGVRAAHVIPGFVGAGVGRLWLQIGVVNHQVRKAASSKDISVVMDKCIKIEHARLFGGLNFVGVTKGYKAGDPVSTNDDGDDF